LLSSSNDTDNKVLRLSRGHIAWVTAAYLFIFLLFFFGIRHGVGQYWDWSFPYFRDQMSTLFFNKSSSWIGGSMGSSLGYSTDYFLRFFVILFGFMQPETLRYVLLVGIFALGSLGMYLLARRHTSPFLSFLLGLVVFINPAIFYKYTAGHFNYLVAFVLFIYMLYYLFYRFKKNLRSAVVIGLFVAGLGVQIQFFIIGAIFLAVFFAFNKQKLAWRYAVVMAGLPFLIHLVWLCNFITGANSTAQTSAAAAQVSFKRSSSSNFLNIFTFNFSAATLLSKFYAFYELLWSAALFIFMLWLLMREKHKQTFDVLLLVFLSIMVFMATGLYQQVSLGPLTVLYPMLREVGHFAPIIVLVVTLLVARLVRFSAWRWILVSMLVGALFIVGVKFQYYSQGYSFAQARQEFAPFKAIADADKSSYRILAYPFFDKYSFKFLPTEKSESILPLQNSGHDSFANFSHQDYIQNAVAPYQLHDSVQYKLLETYDINVLRPYNVKYIFDFSDIYDSSFEHYVPATVYDNDLSLIKNDKNFLNKLLAHNPGKLRRINNHVLEITNYMPHVSATAAAFKVHSQDDGLAASPFVNRALNKDLDYFTDNKSAPYASRLTPLFADPSLSRVDKTTGTFSQTVKANKATQTTAYVNTSYSLLLYQIVRNQLTIYTDSAGSLTLNNQNLTDSQGRRVLMQMPVSPDKHYFVSFAGDIVPLKTGAIQPIGVGKEGSAFEVLVSDGDNRIQNGSFEQGLWQSHVGDCNNYDSDGDVSMRQATQASDGRASLELAATRHDACTHTNIKVDPNTQYLLSFDYQSTNAQTANFFLSYTTDDLRYTKGFRAISDGQWHTLTKLVTMPPGQNEAKLFLYALEQDAHTTTINRYDNALLVKLKSLQSSTLPIPQNLYKKVELGSSEILNFAYTDNNYQYRNLLANGSFERGPWQRKVMDCNNYDFQPNINVRVDKIEARDGKQSLELQATHHDACERNTANVDENTDYVLSFDYKTNGAKYYGYAVSFDDPQNTVNREQLRASKATGWAHAAIKIHAPAHASTATIYLYAFEDNGRTNIVHYDNVAVTPLPDFADRFYVIQSPEAKVAAPAQVTFGGKNPYDKTVHVSGVQAPFFLTLSENYHPKWRLELDNSQVNGLRRWWPLAAGTGVGDHFKMSGYSNAWLIDPAICEKNGVLQKGCTKNNDGSFNINLLAEFSPQRWFVVCAFISWSSLVLSLLYLALSRSQTIPTYQLPLNRWRTLVRRRK
jgi:hypothetical protein